MDCFFNVLRNTGLLQGKRIKKINTSTRMTRVERMNTDFFFASQKEGFYCFAGCRVAEIIQIIPPKAG